MELKYHSFMEKTFFCRKIIFEKKFRTRKFGKFIFEVLPPQTEFPKKSSKNHKSASGGGNSCGIHPKPVFLECRRSLRSKWVIYQPRTTISDDFLILWSWGIFDGFPGNTHFGRFANMWHRREKTKKSMEIIFHTKFISGCVHLLPVVGEFWFLGRLHGLN